MEGQPPPTDVITKSKRIGVKQLSLAVNKLVLGTYAGASSIPYRGLALQPLPQLHYDYSSYIISTPSPFNITYEHFSVVFYSHLHPVYEILSSIPVSLWKSSRKRHFSKGNFPLKRRKDTKSVHLRSATDFCFFIFK